MKVIVSDSSSLIALLNIKRLDILKIHFDQIIIPLAVEKEIEAGGSIDTAWTLGKKSNFIRIEAISQKDPRLVLLELQLDRGESEAILLADKLKTSLLIDERAGRKLAKTMGLDIIGLVGVFYALKLDGHINQNEMERLVGALEQVHFRMSKALKALLLE